MAGKPSTKCIALCSVLLFLSACGQLKNPSPTEEEKTPDSTNPETPETNSVALPGTPKGGLLAQLPASTFITLSWSRPEQTISSVKTFLEKTGGVLDQEEFQKDLEEFKQKSGIDPYSPDAFKKIGIDSSQGIFLSFDSELTHQKIRNLYGSATVEIELQPAIYALAMVSDSNTFYSWVKETLSKNSEGKTYRFEDGLVGGVKAVYVYESPKTSSSIEGKKTEETASISGKDKAFDKEVVEAKVAKKREVAPAKPAPPSIVASDEPPPVGLMAKPDTPQEPLLSEKLIITFVNKGDLLYAFFTDDLGKPSTDLVSDPVSAWQKDLDEFFTKDKKTLLNEPLFEAAAQKMDTQKDFFFYIHSANTESFVRKSKEPTLVFLVPKNEIEKRAQEEEKSWRASRSKSSLDEELMIKSFIAAFPGGGFSIAFEGDKAEMKGLAQIGSAHQSKIEKIFKPDLAVPPYLTLFPEKTDFFYRYTFNPSALKETIFELLPTEIRKKADEGWQQASLGVAAFTGLNLETDILGAFTGHIAFGAPSLEALVAPFAVAERTGKPPAKLPQALAVMQTTTKDAGSKLLTTIETLISGTLGTPVTSEEIKGNKVYSMTIEGLAFAWGQADNLLLLGDSKKTITDAFTRIKTPGKSFTETLDPTAKELVTHPLASGMSFSLGNLLNFVGSQPQTNEEDREMLLKLGAVFNTIVLESHYEKGSYQFIGEITLR